jgi:Secretion system C-terminal sorting domain
MKKLLKQLLLSSIFYCFSLSNSIAQINLIPDGSFEDTTINWQNEWDGLKHWNSFDSTNLCNGFATFSANRLFDTTLKLPGVTYFNQYPKSGQNAIGFANYLDSMQLWALQTIKGLVRSKLTTKLSAGKAYCTTLFVGAGKFPTNSFTNGLDLYFDNGQLDTMLFKHKDSFATFTFVQPQLRNTLLITDTNGWQKVQGSFVANGTEQFVTIGNFRHNDSLSKILNLYHGSDILIDNVSLIPLDLINWLQDVYVAAGDSVWVGLDWRDYSDGIWYTSNMQEIDTMPGFWYKPELPVTTFIQGVDICGVMKYDTMEVYIAPASINTEAKNKLLRIFPNPAKDVVYLEKLSAASIDDDAVIYNCVGQVVAKQRMLMGKNTIDISALPRGLYFIRYGGFEYKVEVW